jgi:hypothetical protein
VKKKFVDVIKKYGGAVVYKGNPAVVADCSGWNGTSWVVREEETVKGNVVGSAAAALVSSARFCISNLLDW